MLNVALMRSTRNIAAIATRASLVSFRPPSLRRARFESTQSPAEAAFKAAQKLNNEMQRDWDARKLTYEDIKPKTLSPSLEAYLIDVREPDEVIQGSIPSSVNMPLSTLGDSFHLNAETFKERFGFEKPRKDQELVFYCRSGKRSASACDLAKRNGFTNIYNYEGSWLDWVEREGAKPV